MELILSGIARSAEIFFCFLIEYSGAEIAQLVEQLIRNQQVDGSNPFLGSIIKSRVSRG